MKKDKIDVLLLVPNVNHAITSNNYLPSLGVCYISSFLSSKNLEVVIIDNYLERLDNVGLLSRINKYEFLILGAYIASREMLFSFLSFIYKNYTSLQYNAFRIVLGGPFAALAYEEILYKFKLVDFIVLGFGEEKIFELHNCLLNEGDFNKITNLAYVDKKTDRIWCRKAVEILPPDLPPPDLKYYLNTFGDKMSYTVSCSRGCTGKCTFCIINLFYENLHGKSSMAHVFKQISYLIENGINEFTFIDDNIFNSAIFEEGNFIEFYHFLNEKDLKFSMSARITDIMKYEKEFRLLHKVGLEAIFVGIESFCDDTLQIFNKGIKRSQIYEMLDFAKNEQIDIFFGFIFFHPWTTVDEINENLTNLEFVYSHYDNLTGSAPIQELQIIYKSPLYYRAEKEGLLKGNLLTKLSFKFENSNVEKIYKKWHSINSNLLLDYLDSKGEIKQLVLNQISELKRIVKEVVENEKI